MVEILPIGHRTRASDGDAERYIFMIYLSIRWPFCGFALIRFRSRTC